MGITEARRRLRELGVSAPWPLLQNGIHPVTGTGYVTISCQGRRVQAWVREEPELAGKAVMFGYLVIDSADARKIEHTANPVPSFVQAIDGEVRFVVRVREILLS